MGDVQTLKNYFASFIYPLESRIYGVINDDDQYLDMSSQELGAAGFIELCKDLEADDAIQHLNVSGNIQIEEVQDFKKMTELTNALVTGLERNHCLVALNLSKNCLGYASPHPANKHTIEYLTLISKALGNSKIEYLDISDNNILGESGRIYKSLTQLMRNYVSKKCKILKCRGNKLHSQGFRIISEGLSHQSLLEHLDLSNNLGGIDPLGNPNSEGVSSLTKMMAHCHTLRELVLTNNRLRDDDIVLIAQALLVLPQLQLLDISKNSIEIFGAEALKESILAHAALKSHTEGLHVLDLSHMDINEDCLQQIATAVRASDSLQLLNMHSCGLSEASAVFLRNMLGDNTELIRIGISANRISPALELEIHAETEANQLLMLLEQDPYSLCVDQYTTQTQCSLGRKLRFLPAPILRALHENPSFEDEASVVRDELFRLSPPLRRHMFQKVLNKHSGLRERLEQSTLLARQLDASRTIYRSVLRWFKRLKFRRKLRRIKARV